MKVTGTVAIVLGGCGGIGKATVETLLSKGAKVCFGDIMPQEGETLCTEMENQFGKGKVLFAKCDVRKEDDIEGIFGVTVDRFGLPEIVVYTAGLVNEAKWENCVDVNLVGVIRATNVALNRMRKDRGGKGGIIINMASIGALKPIPVCPVYCATKYGVLGFTLSWALPKHYQCTGVRLNCICPTSVDTSMTSTEFEGGSFYFPDEVRKFYEAVDFISPEYVADGVVELIEDDSINGRAMRVSKAYGRDYADFPDQPLQ